MFNMSTSTTVAVTCLNGSADVNMNGNYGQTSALSNQIIGNNSSGNVSIIDTNLNSSSHGNSGGNGYVSVVYLSSWIWTLYVIIGVVGIFGNSLVALIMLSVSNLRGRLANVYVINQSLIDFTTSLFLLLTTLFQDQSVLPGLAGEFKCRVWLTKVPFWSAYISSSMNLVAITFERYLKIVHPIRHRVSFNRQRAVASVVVIWVLGYAYELLRILPTTAIYNGQCLGLAFWPSPAAKKVATVVHFLLQYFIPLVAFVIFYSKMALALKRGTFHNAVVPGSNPPVMSQQNKQQNSANGGFSKGATTSIVKTMFVVSFTFALCLSVNQWLFFFYNMGLVYDIYSKPIYYVSVIAMYLNCCLNPLIYASTYQQFRDVVRRLFTSPKAAANKTSSQASNVVAKTTVGL